MTLRQRLTAEGLGTCFLVAAVVGSGIMAERLSAGNVAVALLCNAIATGAALVALILTFGPISGAHFNPAVTLSDATQGNMRWSEVLWYVVAQCGGSVTGVALANVMFGLPVVCMSHHERSGQIQALSEFVATFGLLSTIWACSRRQPAATPFGVAAYIVAAYWFTPSTSFANPAVTLARALTDTFAGIRPLDVPAFVVAQIVGAIAATVLFRWLLPPLSTVAPRVAQAHPESIDTKEAVS
jgi:glycerol uptake facilitator-like aquaporin